MSAFIPPPSRAAPSRNNSTSGKSWQSEYDQLMQETAQLKQDVSDINSNLLDIELLRDSVASSDASPTDILPSLRQLQTLTTTTGHKIVAISEPLASVQLRVATLAEDVSAGKAAATSLEIDRQQEELETIKLSIKESMDRIQTLAAEEATTRESDLSKWRDRIRKFNEGIEDDAVERAVREMLDSGSRTPVARLDMSSYAGRFAAEHPFLEFVQLLEQANSLHRSASFASGVTSAGGGTMSTMPLLSRVSSQATLVPSTMHSTAYDKLEEGGNEDPESQPLAGDPLRRFGGGSDGGTAYMNKNQSLWRRKWFYAREHWRDVLVRACLGAAILSTIVGIVAWTAYSRSAQEAAWAATSAESAAASLG